MCLLARALRSGPRPLRKMASDSVDMVRGFLVGWGALAEVLVEEVVSEV
jgi:hypothetical protein